MTVAESHFAAYDGPMDTKQTTDRDAAYSPFTVELLVHHGDYKATFTGSGSSMLDAAREAARQTAYASALFDENDYQYSKRERYRFELQDALIRGQEYRGYGWNTFKLIDSAVDQDSIPDPVDAAVEAGTYPKLISEEQAEELIHAHAVAVRRDSIRLFPESYNETTPLGPFLIEAQRSVLEALEVLEYAHAALQMQKDED